jgi:predicted O-methyltransferase YrrM
MGNNPFLPAHVEQYVTAAITRETSVQKRLREETMQMPMHVMQISPDEAEFLAMLVRMIDAKNVLEIGTFTGYSALAMALALPEGGRLTACDISKEWTDIARRYWQEAGVAGKINLRLAPAKETLDALLKEGKKDSFDLAFIDADKTGYDGYYEACLKLVHVGGLIAFDNMLWGGAVADPKENASDTKALRALNLKLRDDPRVDMCLLTVADGVALARRRA